MGLYQFPDTGQQETREAKLYQSQERLKETLMPRIWVTRLEYPMSPRNPTQQDEAVLWQLYRTNVMDSPISTDHQCNIAIKI